MDSAIGFSCTDPLDSDLSSGWHYPTFEQLGPDGQNRSQKNDRQQKQQQSLFELLGIYIHVDKKTEK